MTSEIEQTPIDKLLLQDHNVFKSLHEKYSNATENQKKYEFAHEFIRQLCMHAISEELCVYPAIGKHLDQKIADHERAQHQALKIDLYALDKMKIDEPDFDDQFNRIMKSLVLHMEEEEHEVLPKLRKALGNDGMKDLGSQFEKYKATAPTHPHPSAPDKPPFLNAVGPIAAMLDRLYDSMVREA
jgi:hemerythrin superfamily protein